MIKIIEQEINIDEFLKKKLESIFDFCNTTPIFINGSIRKIDKTNNKYKNIKELSITLIDVDT